MQPTSLTCCNELSVSFVIFISSSQGLMVSIQLTKNKSQILFLVNAHSSEIRALKATFFIIAHHFSFHTRGPPFKPYKPFSIEELHPVCTMAFLPVARCKHIHIRHHGESGFSIHLMNQQPLLNCGSYSDKINDWGNCASYTSLQVPLRDQTCLFMSN